MKTPVTAPQNAFFDSENVDDSDLTREQDYNNLIQQGIRNNHFGSGVLPDALVRHQLFDSSLVSGLLDGKAISVQAQPTDGNLGNQLEVVLTGSAVARNRTVKVLIIGLDFESNLQYDSLTFQVNEAQVTRRHYRTVLTVLFNDLLGSQPQSLNLGGTVVIREALPFSMSRDCVMTAQDSQPNLFFRDFFVASGGTVANVLAATLPSYNISQLGIQTGYTQLRTIVENDVTSQIGEKFLATTNNIQKVTLLMSCTNPTTPSNLVWTGDLIVSLYPLQTVVGCQTDITPGLAIDFDPSNIPVVQLSLTYASLQQQGIQLTGVPQPVDFVFSNTSVGSGLVVQSGLYYAITAHRAGSADTGQLQFAVGSNTSSTTTETLFSSGVWTDVPAEALWFQVWTDAAKVSDGQAYDAGQGIVIPKTDINPTTQLSEDYQLGQIQFVRNDLYYALAQATTQKSVPVTDERTGNPVLSQQETVPTITLVNQTGLASLVGVTDPLIIGTIEDANIKTTNQTPLLYRQHGYGMVGNQLVLKVVTDTTDGYRYDPSIIELVSELVEGNLHGAILTPNAAAPNTQYRIVKGELITQTYGDVNGDGVVDEADLLAIQGLTGYNLNSFPAATDYRANSTSLASAAFSSATAVQWSVINPIGNITEASGVDGYLAVDPLDPTGTAAAFGSASANFISITNLGLYQLVISGQTTNLSNNGSFAITGITDNHTISIQKRFYSSDRILEIMRADIDGDMAITAADGYLLGSYVSLSPPFPATTSPGNRVGTQFQAIRLTVERLVDRNDDYPSTATNRSTTLHPLPDMYLDGYGAFAGQNLMTTPLQFSIVRQLCWTDSSVVCSSAPRLVPAAFIYQDAGLPPSGDSLALTSESFPTPPAFNPGRNDFFVPGNLVMGGRLTQPDGYLYRVDFESVSLVFEVPAINFGEKIVNCFTDLVCDFAGLGVTRIGLPALRYSDGTTVGINDLAENRVRFSVGLQSLSPQINGVDPSCLSGLIVDGKVGVAFDPTTGLLTLAFANLFQDPVQQTLNTKIQLTVYLKRAGFVNPPSVFIGSDKTQNLLGIPTPPLSQISCPDPTTVVVA